MARLATYGIAILFPLAVVGHGPCRGMTVADCQVNEGNIIHRYKSWDYHFPIFLKEVFMLPIPQVQLQRCHLWEPVQEVGSLPVLASLSEWKHAAARVPSSQYQLSPGNRGNGGKGNEPTVNSGLFVLCGPHWWWHRLMPGRWPQHMFCLHRRGMPVCWRKIR